MTPDAGSHRAHKVSMPYGVASVATLPHADDTYACQIATPDANARSAEQWARAIFADAPRLVRSVIIAGWIGVLRLKLASRRSPTHVLGWTIVSATPDAVLLEVESPLLRAQLVVQVDEGTVIHATFVACHNRLGRVLWAVAAPIHHLAIPYLLTHAAASPD